MTHIKKPRHGEVFFKGKAFYQASLKIAVERLS